MTRIFISWARVLGSRAGCVVALGILVLALLSTVFALVLAGVMTGFVQRTLSGVPAVAGALPGGGGGSHQLSGHGSFSGAVTGDTDGAVVLFGGVTGTCASRARHVSGVGFTDVESSDGGRKVLSTRATLPPGVEGPGTYDLSEIALQVSADYAFTPDRTAGEAKPESQVWRVEPGQTRAVLVIRPDGSGTLTLSGLAPTVQQAAGNSLGQPLAFSESFSCR